MARLTLRGRRRERTLDPVRPSVGLETHYRTALDRLIQEMQRSLVHWLSAAYRRSEPAIMAIDATPARELDAEFRRLAARWQARFDGLADDLATTFAQRAEGRARQGTEAALRRAGMTVKFTMSAPARDVLQAVTIENVGLIKSIARQHLQDVQGILMRSVSRGGDLGEMTQELEERYGVTRRRAALIARDQNQKATAALTRVRQKEIGVTEAIWMHSHAGRHPRPSHVAADGKKYQIDKGMYLDGEWLLPGQAINCRCICRPIIPGLAQYQAEAA